MKLRGWTFKNRKAGLLVLVGSLATLPVVGANYQDTVKQLQPTYYYELNETDPSTGAIDSMGNAAEPGEFNGDYENGPPMVGAPGPLVVFNPDDPAGTPVPGVGGEENLAHMSNNAGHVTLGPGERYGANDMTVAVFIKAGQGAQGGDRVFTNNLTDGTKSFQINIGNNGLVLAVDPSQAGQNAERTLYMEDNSGHDRRFLQSDSGWFHVVASTSGQTGAERASNFQIWVNGVNRTDNLMPDSTGWGTDTGLAKIGGRRANPTDTTTHSGGQDEVAIWLNRVLTEEEVEALWQAALNVIPPRVTVNSIFRQDTPGGDELVINWESKSGKLYTLRSETDLSAGTPREWPVFGAHVDMEATPPENSLTLQIQPSETERFFVIEETNAPPVEIYAEDFESGQGAWTVGSDGADGTVWELGAPGAPGPAAANSPTNCFGTNLTSEYGLEADVWLRSPEIDLTTAGGATLHFFSAHDIEPMFDAGIIRVLDAADDSELAVVESGLDGTALSWGSRSYPLPNEALGKNVKFEFRLVSDDFSSFAGWYVDDVSVTIP